jgi:membrane-associated protease RseP (regulator of RpoE activity)
MKRVLALVIAVGVAGSTSVVQAGEKTNAKEGHLGLAVEAVPQALYSHMPNILTKGHGVLVDQVAKNSPAAKAGLEPYDILVSLDDQKLTSPQQLVKMIRHDKPGQQVSVSFLRAGKTMSCKVTLDEADHTKSQDHSRVYRFFPDERIQKMFDEMDAKTSNSAWNLFDGIKLTRTDGKHWRAEVEYRNKDGKKDKKTYNGTRDEIRKAIENEKDLPQQERDNLLQALNLRPSVFEFHFPPLGPEGSSSNRP